MMCSLSSVILALSFVAEITLLMSSGSIANAFISIPSPQPHHPFVKATKTSTLLLFVRKPKKKTQRQPANHGKDWQTFFEKVEAHGNAHGGVYDLDEMEPDLAAWLEDQRVQCRFVLAGQGKKGRITKKRADAMVRAGMVTDEDNDDDDDDIIIGDDWKEKQASEERGRIGRQRLKGPS